MTFSAGFCQLIHDEMECGRYPNEEALLRDALVALAEVRRNRDELRAEVNARLESDDDSLSEPLDLPAFLAEARRRLPPIGRPKSPVTD